ncbi:sensor histidine kinase [Gemmatimonas sp.]|jgi:two-component system LytT family sensor kinase|uniref:sensor histidine kinase n=1 Tax=Gemmatimonas sp. TaxID=1962908 RepID=UPI0037C1A8D8
MTRTRLWTVWLRRLAWYMAAWSPLVLVFAMLIGASSGETARSAINAALTTVIWAAVLGLGVIWLAQRWSWPVRPTARFFLVHAGMALLYAALWDAFILLGVRQSVASWELVGKEVAAWLHWQTFEGVLIYATLCGVTWARQSAARGRAQESRLAHIEAERARAELEALRGRLDPHFLFNTLHSVTVLIQHDPVSAAQAVERLSALLRYVLDSRQGGQEEVLLADEVAFTDAYLALELLRLGARLRVDRDFSAEALRHRVPSFVVQSLVENAIKHSIAPRAAGGVVRLRGHVTGAQLVLEVSDDGPGQPASDATHGMGVGLSALRQRMAVLYGDTARVDVRAVPGDGFGVWVHLPI